jgi:hypothetical protein
MVDLVNEENCPFVLSAFVTGMDNTFTLRLSTIIVE